MHHRIRKRAGSADEEDGGLISFNASQLEDHNNHHHHSHHNHYHNSATPTAKRSIHPSYQETSNRKSVNSWNSVKPHLSYSITYRWSYISGMGCLLSVGLCLAIVLTVFSIFSVFHVGLRGRPEWLYGKPVSQNNISTCLVDPHLLSLQEASPRVLWEWHNYTTPKK